ncbi:MAG: hypothetical protein ACLFO4_03165 [Candidatus Acetothermia bacterium]
MDIQFGDREIEIGEKETISALIEQVKEKLSSTNERLVGIKLGGEFLSQNQLDRKMEEELIGKDVELVTETTEALSDELVVEGLSYLDDLDEWEEGISYPEEGDILSEVDEEELEQLLEGFHWLNLALEELVSTSEGSNNLGGRSFSKFISENRLFLNELQGALENPDENPRLIGTLVLQDLPTWIEEYRGVFLDLRGAERRGVE